MSSLKPKDIVLLDVAFHDKKTGRVYEKGKRPCVIVRVKDNEIQFRTITSQKDKYPATEYGVEIKKNNLNNLNKDSSILCTKDNTYSIPLDKAQNLKKIGEITTDQLLSTLRKSVICNRKDIQLRYSVKLGKQQGL